jgi:hypothetical protein
MHRHSLAHLVRAEKGATVQRLMGSTVIPLVENGEEEYTSNVDDWAAWRVQQSCVIDTGDGFQ